MEFANDLQDEVTCMICYRIFHDPHILTGCLHTFCFDCIKAIEKNFGHIVCPKCRAQTNIAYVRKDFNIQRILDIYNTRAQGTTNKTCELCADESQLASSYCVECEKFTCEDCHRVHINTDTTRRHTLKKVSELTKGYKVSVQTAIAQFIQQVDDIDAKLVQVCTKKRDIEKSNRDQIEVVKRFTADIINEVKQNESQIVKLIEDTNDNLCVNLIEKEEILTKIKQHVLSKITSLENQVNSQDVVNLQKTAQDLNGNLKMEISEIQSSYQNMQLGSNSSVNVRKNVNWNVTDSIVVNIQQPTKPNCNLPNIYTQLWTKTFQQNKKVSLDYQPVNLTYGNNQLWCVSNSGGDLNIYDKNCTHLKTVNLDTVFVNSLTVSDTGYVILAFAQELGLHECLPSGEYNKQIVNGNYSDVTTFDGELYALEYHKQKLMVFKRNDQQWDEVKQHNLNYNHSSQSDRVSVNGKNIYVSSFNNDTVTVYDSQGLCVQTFAQFSSPLLCGVDEAGNILVADSWNHRLQVYDSSSGQWHVVTLPTEVRYPLNAVVGDGGELWTVQGADWQVDNEHGTLVKFSTGGN